MIKEWIRGHYGVSTDPRRLDLDVIHGFLSQHSYWAGGIVGDRFVDLVLMSILEDEYRAS